jgi:hypothetical protein
VTPPALVVELAPHHYAAICLRCRRNLPGRHPLRSDALTALHDHAALNHEETP